MSNKPATDGLELGDALFDHWARTAPAPPNDDTEVAQERGRQAMRRTVVAARVVAGAHLAVFYVPIIKFGVGARLSLADIVMAGGSSAWALLAQASLLWLLTHALRGPRRWRAVSLLMCTVPGLTASALAYGAWRFLGALEASAEPRLHWGAGIVLGVVLLPIGLGWRLRSHYGVDGFRQ